jgi:hypothetical protein
VSAISIDSTAQLWAAYGDARVRAWNGAAWTEKTVGNNHIQYVWGTADDEMWAISPGVADAARHWNGSTWDLVDFPFGGYLIGGMWGSSANDYWVAAGNRVANGVELHMIHWNGTAWSDSGSLGMIGNAVSAPYMMYGFQAVWGSAANDVYAANGTSALWHYDGTTWSTIAGRGGTDVFGSGASDVYVTNTNNVSHWDGTTWTDITPPAPVSSIWVNSPTDVWFTGLASSYHYDKTFFVTYSGIKGRPVGTTSKMYIADTDTITEWPTGSTGSSISYPAPFASARSGWALPGGRAYLAGAGLITHP